MPKISAYTEWKEKVSLPLKWHGGKHYLADWIINQMPMHIHYVEPYFGGGAVLFRKPCEGVSEVINDLNGQLMNFWRVLKDPFLFSEFRSICEITPFSEVVWKESVINQHMTPLGRALAFFVTFRQSRQGLGQDFATISRNRTRRGMNEQVSSWLSAVEGLEEAHNRLRRVLILHRDALNVISTQDGPNTLFYLDPPYHPSTRSAQGCYGDFEMTTDDHDKLLSALCLIKGKFMLSGYHCPSYDKWAKLHDYRCEEYKIRNNASAASRKQLMTECLWMNF